MSAKDIRVVPGKIFGYHLETDDFVEMHGGGGLYEHGVTVELRGEVRHFKLCVEQYLERVSKAVRDVNVMNIPVERVTILAGVVQAHPPVAFHWRCPHCYPAGS